MNEQGFKEKFKMPDEKFKIKLLRYTFGPDTVCFTPHWHERLELLLIDEGEMTMGCSGKSFVCKPHDIVVINASQIHFAKCTQSSVRYRGIIIDFENLRSRNADIVEEKYIMPTFASEICFQNHIQNAPMFENCLNRIFEEYAQKADGYELMIKSLLFEITAILIRSYRDQGKTNSTFKNERILASMEYIDKHYSEKLTTQDLARNAAFNLSYYCKKFKYYVGSPPLEYLNFVRALHAEEYLKTGKYTVTEAAMMVGFSNSNYFARIFKKKLGKRPSDLIPRT